MSKSKTLTWIKDVREGCKKTIRQDLEIILKMFEESNWDDNKFTFLLQEIRDKENEDSLLSLIQIMLEEEGGA